MLSILRKFKNILKGHGKLKNESYKAAKKLEQESNELNFKVENYLQDAKQIDKEWRNKWLK